MKCSFTWKLSACLLVALYWQAIPCQADSIVGKAEVLRIENKAWELTADDRVIDHGEICIDVRISEPDKYKTAKRKMCAYKKADLVFNGRTVAVGDVFSFDPEAAVFEQRVAPDVISNFEHRVILPTTGSLNSGKPSTP